MISTFRYFEQPENWKHFKKSHKAFSLLRLRKTFSLHALSIVRKLSFVFNNLFQIYVLHWKPTINFWKNKKKTTKKMRFLFILEVKKTTSIDFRNFFIRHLLKQKTNKNTKKASSFQWKCSLDYRKLTRTPRFIENFTFLMKISVVILRTAEKSIKKLIKSSICRRSNKQKYKKIVKYSNFPAWTFQQLRQLIIPLRTRAEIRQSELLCV